LLTPKICQPFKQRVWKQKPRNQWQSAWHKRRAIKLFVKRKLWIILNEGILPDRKLNKAQQMVVPLQLWGLTQGAKHEVDQNLWDLTQGAKMVVPLQLWGLTQGAKHEVDQNLWDLTQHERREIIGAGRKHHLFVKLTPAT
jgi:hypothetical protein